VTEFDKVIPPGGVGKVTASLNTFPYKGPITKSVQVTTGDPGARPVVLLLKAEIVTSLPCRRTPRSGWRSGPTRRRPPRATRCSAHMAGRSPPGAAAIW